MDFLESYKRADNFCKDAFLAEKGITTYIEEMKMKTDIRFQSNNWSDDLKTLKDLRHKRNNIAHENGYTVENTIKKSDEVWMEDFYNRLINQTDPLSLYKKAQKIQRQKVRNSQVKMPKHYKKINNKKQDSFENTGKWFTIAVLIFIIFLLMNYILY